jgi:2',3'-cyclic-nucleotide 2'-phosphodiesterase/3'-nucleotidase
MKKIIVMCLTALLSFSSMSAKTKTINLRIIQTSDVHGSFFPYDFINRKPKEGTMARVITYVDSLRKTYGRNLILLDNGDILQGQPTCYWCNYIQPKLPNVAAQIVNYMGYDAEAVGNHDIETGHKVYDKWIKEVKCPMLGANIIDTKTGKPYVKPYTIIRREGLKIAVLGMLTPAIPNWLNESLWQGMRFDDITKSARQWIKYLKDNEKPDIIIGLFHSGKSGGISTDKYEEDASMRVAKEVAGFDMILFGHDHHLFEGTVKGPDGRDVLLLDPSSNAHYVADAQIKAEVSEKTVEGKHQYQLIHKNIEGKLTKVDGMDVDKTFITHFQADIDSVNNFVNRKIGTFTKDVYTRDCYFGSAPLTDFIHDIQLKITGAEISLNAPLTFDECIKAGDIHVSDLFNLYKYENQMYAMRMTGKEIRKHLEMSYDLWVNTMKNPTDHIMQLDSIDKNGQEHFTFKNLAFNFDSAAGINYTVDVTKPDGEKVQISSLTDGRPFNENEWYKVAVNSYRGNGGGELLTRGAGIPHDELKNRIIYESERDQRYYLMKAIEKEGTITPVANNNWHFVPENWTKTALERDKALIFNNDK